MGIEPLTSLLRLRVINRHDAGDSELTSDLPHLHSSTWTTVAFQPGNPGSNSLGSFTIPLFPPGTEQYAAAKATYDQLKRYQRVEAYISPDGASLGKLAFAGVITGIRKAYGPNPVYELTGAADLALANYSRPFPGELLASDVTSAILKSYLGQNELGVSDAFNPFTSGNYTSTNLPALTSGTWSGTTDDGLNVVSCATGSGAVLLSKTGALPGDRWNTHYVEVTGRLKPSADTTNAGQVGIGISSSNANLNNSIFGYVNAVKQSSGRYSLNATLFGVSGGVISPSPPFVGVLTNVDDQQGFIALTIGLLFTQSGNAAGTQNMTVIVNGKAVIGQWTTTYSTAGTQFPALLFAVPNTGTATCYLTNLVQMTRFTTDGSSAAATFGNGTITATTNQLQYGVDPGPSFLEAWARLATRENFYLRYTPQAYKVGTRTLGTVDFAADPGTDRTASVIFSRSAGNLIDNEFNNNGDPLAADTALNGQSTLDGGGAAFWRDVSTLGTYGVIQDEALGFTHSDFNSLRQGARQLITKKVALDTLGAKTVTVLRDPQFADTYRELDKITVHDPEMGLNMAAVRIMARTFTEDSATESLVLDQFSEEFGA